MSTLADRLRAIRKSKGYSQMDLADMIELSNGSISAIEQGRSSPTDTLNLIADRLGVDRKWLIDGIGEPPEWVKMVTKPQTSALIDVPWRDEAYSLLKQENEKLWEIVRNLTGGNSFPKSPKTANAILRVIRGGAFLGDQLGKVA